MDGADVKRCDQMKIIKEGKVTSDMAVCAWVTLEGNWSLEMAYDGAGDRWGRWLEDDEIAILTRVKKKKISVVDNKKRSRFDSIESIRFPT